MKPMKVDIKYLNEKVRQLEESLDNQRQEDLPQTRAPPNAQANETVNS
jgi:hypothetical protein